MTTITYVAETHLGGGFTEMTGCEIVERTGNIVYLKPPARWEELQDITLVIDPDGDLWARDESGRDGYLGWNAQIVE